MGKKKSLPRGTVSAEAVDEGNATPDEFGRQAEPLMAVLSKAVTTDNEKAAYLRAYHRLGSLSLKLVPDRPDWGSGLLKKHAKAINCRYDFLSLARRFATRYSETDLGELCKRPLVKSHLNTLVDITDKKQRAKLQKQAYDDKLPVAALRALKKQHLGRKRGGGAPIKIPTAPRVAVTDLLDAGEAWVRRCDATIAKLAKVGDKRVPADLQQVSAEGIMRLKAIAKAARQAEKELKRLSGDG